MIPVTHLLYLSFALFGIGTLGVLFRRGVLFVLMSLELMLNAANIAFVGFSRMHANHDGQIFAMFVIGLAAAEAAVGLAIVVSLFRARTSSDVDDLSALRD